MSTVRTNEAESASHSAEPVAFALHDSELATNVGRGERFMTILGIVGAVGLLAFMASIALF